MGAKAERILGSLTIKHEKKELLEDGTMSQVDGNAKPRLLFSSERVGS